MTLGGTLLQNAKTLWHVQRVKKLVRDELGEGVPCIVSVNEAICMDPECEGPATLIRIIALDFSETKAFVHKALPDVTQEDVIGVIHQGDAP